MKTNLLIVLVTVGILLVGGGIYFLTQSYQPNANNNSQSNNPPVNISSSKPPSSSGSSAPTNHDVEIKGFAFSPKTLTINEGDSVTWTNKDSASHTVTSDSGSELSSSSFGNGKTYTHTFTTKGTFNYHCSIHSTMKGTIIVS